MKSCRRIYDGWFTLGGVLRISNQSGKNRLASNNNVSDIINSKNCGPSAILSNLSLTINECSPCSPTLQQENKRTPFLMFNHVFPISFGLKCLNFKFSIQYKSRGVQSSKKIGLKWWLLTFERGFRALNSWLLTSEAEIALPTTFLNFLC